VDADAKARKRNCLTLGGLVLPYFSNGIEWVQNPYRFLDERSKAKGFTFSEHIPALGKVLFTGDPEVIEQIIQNEDLHAGRAISILNQALGEKSLITLDGQSHTTRKKMLLPLMTESSVKRFDELTVQLTRDTFSSCPNGTPFSAYAKVREISLKVIIELLVGGTDRQTSSELFDASDRFLRCFDSAAVLLIPFFRINLGPNSPWGKALKERNQIEQIVLQHVSRKSSGNDDSLSFVQIARAAMENRNEISTSEIAAEAMALLAFGHDTAAATLAWAFNHLLSSAGLIARLKDASLSDRQFEELVEASLLESMRLNPVVVHLSRKAVTRTKVGDRNLDVNQIAAPSAFLAQRNPEYFPNPESFIPDRFLESAPPKYSYFPFGLGHRTCYGRPLAMRQMNLILTTVIREFKLQLIQPGNAKPVRKLVLMTPEHGTLMARIN
jgi:cytochrome P450